MPAFAARLAVLRQVQLVRYLGASVIALACDFACFMALLRGGLAPAPASALGYGLGIAVHWLVSSRKVFAGSVADPGPARTRQKALFVGSALVGLAVTTAVVAGATALGLNPRLAKLIAVGISFAITWLLRDSVVFRKPAPA
jgi:putative flippase GtrA